MQAIIIQTFIAVPPEAAWAALETGADVLFDGLPARGWPARRDEQAPFHFKTAWPFTASAGRPTDVAVTLHVLGDGTRVDVRHEGWGEGPAWDEAIQGHFAGWLHGLASLGLLAETGRDARVRDAALKDRERYFVSGEVPASAAAVYRSLVDPEALNRWSRGLLDEAERVEEVENRLVRWRMNAGEGPRPELVMVLRPTPRGTHVALAEYGVTDRSASDRWPMMFEWLTRYLT